MRPLATLLLGAVLLLAAPVGARTVTIDEALKSTRRNNITWKSLAEGLEQIDALRDTAIALFLPKLSAELSWVHLGERHTPDLGGFADMGAVLGQLVTSVLTAHPERAGDFAPFADLLTADSSSGGGFDSFVPVQDMITGTFSVLVPIIDPTTIPFLQGAYDRYDAVVQRVGHGQEQLLFAVAKAYYGVLTVQSLIDVADRSIEAAREHHKSSEVRAGLQSATQLEVKRAELEVTRAESQRIEFGASLEKAKSSFRYLTGLTGDLALTEPALERRTAQSLDQWQDVARRQRKDLVAARIELQVADHELDQVWMKYLPAANLFGQATLDNNQDQRFDDDPFNWTVGASLTWTLWDGGIREAELKAAESKHRQAQLAVEDLERKIASEIETAYQGLADARAALALAERQLEVALATQQLAQASEDAGVATNLEVIDANTLAFASEAQILGARLGEAMAWLDLLGACGSVVPFGGAE